MAAALPASAALTIAWSASGASARGRLRSIDVATLPFPGIATDYKPLLVTMLTVADGVGIVSENLFSGRQVTVPFRPYPYQLEGIAFLMPRTAALLADEMGLGKTAQALVALRLLFHAGIIRRALLVCPKPIVANWSRELRTWAEDIPFEVIGGDTDARRSSWLVSNCPLKLINYELLTRDAGFVADEKVAFDVVVLDEAQRIKNRDSKTAQVVRSIRRDRSWALTGTPIENKPDDLVNIFAFVDPGRIPPDTPTKRLPRRTAQHRTRSVWTLPHPLWQKSQFRVGDGRARQMTGSFPGNQSTRPDDL